MNGDSLEPFWRGYLSACDLDAVLPHEDQDAIFSALGAANMPLLYRQLPIPVIAVIAATGKPREHYRQVDVPIISPEDPWWLAYAAQFGRWPTAPDADILTRFGIVADTPHDAVIPVTYENLEGSGEEFYKRIAERTSLTPIDASLISLSYPSGVQTWFSTTGFLPSPFEWANEYGPDIAVIYSPDSAEDLALLWALRAANGWPRGLPVGFPVFDAENEVRLWRGRTNNFSLGPLGLAITSASVSTEILEQIADDHPADVTVVDPQLLIRPPVWPARTSSDIAYFENGSAQTRAWSLSDVDYFPRAAKFSKNLETKLRIRPTRKAVPPLTSLRFIDRDSNFSYRDGYFETSSRDRSATVNVRWPTEWTTLEAYARDYGLHARKSNAGIACEQFLSRLGSIEAVDAIRDPEVQRLFLRLSEQTGMSWFRGRMRAVTSEIEGIDEPTINDFARAVAQPNDEAPRHLTFGQIQRYIGDHRSTNGWIGWGVKRGVLIEGVTIKCPICTLSSWTAFQEITMPILCAGCGNSVENPFPANQIAVHYRLAYPVLRVLNDDLMSHVLATWWLRMVFRPTFSKIDELVGLYPGVLSSLRQAA